ncbi:monooxygenase [Sphingomonas sp. Root710]|uniref:flavin-containing monooxygenase n=1 Tax=Sphingomonas sp. Root710 TaxID=1736594 RepID=UPI0006F7965E|nr:NAD(P)/FAD-dependent oxidoreductase [Sphingomonas sp. Root710]KRB85568.1 monooxygenase [Sphingomonas sp. Root710]
MATTDDGAPNVGSPHDALGFDLAALREKYRRERDKRLRSDGENQYLEVAGQYARYAEEDPFAPPGFRRAPLTVETEVAVIGGGFSGLLASARLREAGVRDVRIIEAGADFGGAWYWNRYPGAQCDIDSYCYLPVLEELGYMPSEKYTYAPEIFEHCQRIGRSFNLYEGALFQTRVKELRWNAERKLWHVRTNLDDDIEARFIVTATGSTSRPKLPGIPGIDTFKGRSFHTCRWDYDYTGGDNKGGLAKLADKRVAIIGTGSTAIQCVPYVAADARQLHVFQRTPCSVDVRGNAPTDLAWVAGLEPGWQDERRNNFEDIISGKPFEVDLVDDGWTDIYRNLQTMVSFGEKKDGENLDARLLAEIADFQKMNKIRDRVDQIVRDPRTAEALKPWYRQHCKRPGFNDDYLEVFNRPNVTLVDVSDSRGVEAITETGLVANGIDYPVDCIIFATGFEITTSLRRRIDYDVLGEGGTSIFDHWSAGVRTLHGHSTRGFPNWFAIGISQNGVSANNTFAFDSQARHLAYIISRTIGRGASTVQPTENAEAAWVAEIRSKSSVNREFLDACTPGFHNNEGRFGETVGAHALEIYAPGARAFNAILAEWRANGQLEGLEFG